MSTTDRSAVLAKISSINAVEGFDPTLLAVDYTDMNTGETRKRLPVMAQMAWFRLKYPEGRFTLNVTAGKDCFVATARVYSHYTNPLDQFLSEATASRGPHPFKPSISPREWAQTAALGIALRNAGFGLQFHAAGESYDEPVAAVNELVQSAPEASVTVSDEDISIQPEAGTTRTADDPMEKALKTPCPLKKYNGKTLGDIIAADPGAIVWIANKFTSDPEIAAAAKLLCEHSITATAQ